MRSVAPAVPPARSVVIAMVDSPPLHAADAARPAHGQNLSSRAPGRRGRAENRRSTMDIERINAIGNHVADLSERTTALRGYL